MHPTENVRLSGSLQGARTNIRVKGALADYRLKCSDAEQTICGYVDLYLDERAAILCLAFKEHAKLHVSVNFNTCCGGNNAMQGRKCSQCLFQNADSIFRVVMKHVPSEAVEDETLAVAGILDIKHIVPLAQSACERAP
jgi:hypothetical protein